MGGSESLFPGAGSTPTLTNERHELLQLSCEHKHAVASGGGSTLLSGGSNP